jgi:hypothetical protein
MSDATGRAEMERRLIEKSLQDDAFRQRLIEDPKAAVEQELGTQLPEVVRVVAVEETADTIYLVLPFRSTEAREASELSDRELETVAGGAPGGTSSGDTCSTAACWGFTCLDPSECE